jgi:hypothetical protein
MHDDERCSEPDRRRPDTHPDRRRSPGSVAFEQDLRPRVLDAEELFGESVRG